MKLKEFVDLYQKKCDEKKIDPMDSKFGLAFVVDKTIRMKMIEKAGTTDSDEYKNIKLISEKYKTQFDIINNETILNWLLLQKESDKNNENNIEIIKSLFNSTKNNDKDIDKDHKTLTESSIETLFEINKNYELKDKLKEELKRNQDIRTIINELVQTYNFYYVNDKPYGVITKGGVYRIEKAGNTGSKEFKYRLIKDDNNYLENFTEYLTTLPELKDKFAYKYIEDFDDFKPNDKDKYCYPKFILAIISGVLGIYEPLSNYLIKKGISFFNNESQLEEFLKEEIPDIMADICINNNWVDKDLKETSVNLIHNQIFKNVINGFKNSFVVEEYEDNVNTKLRICNCDLKSGDSDFKNKDSKYWKLFSKLCTGAEQSPMLITEYQNTYSGQCASDSGQRIIEGIPSWAYKNIDNIIKSGGIQWNAVPIGKNIKKETAVRLDFSDNFGWMVNLIAGSGSGKGVTTMAIVGAAIAMKYPILYLDCKPDMANSISKWGGLALDGNESNHFISQKELEEMANAFIKEYNISLGNGVSIEDIYALCRTIIWCRAVEIFMHLVHIRAQYKGNNPVLENIKNNIDPISGEKRVIHPVLVMDEFQAESQIIQSMIDATPLKTIAREEGSGAKEVKTISSALINMISDTQDLNRILKWVNGIWGTGPEGMRGQIKTAFGRQAGCLFFTISQNIPSGYSNDTTYGSLLVEMLKDYINTGFIAIYGRGTDTGTTKYSLSRIMPNASDNNQLKMGQFGIKHTRGEERTKTYLTIDDAVKGDELTKGKGAYKSIVNPTILKQALEQIATDVEIEPDGGELKIKKAKVFERRIDTLEYIYSLANDGKQAPEGTNIPEALKDNFTYSVKYFEIFCQALYKKSLKERLTTIKRDDFYNILGCNQASETNREALKNKKKLEDYAKALYYWEHAEEIDNFFKIKEEEDKKIEEKAKMEEIKGE